MSKKPEENLYPIEKKEEGFGLVAQSTGGIFQEIDKIGGGLPVIPIGPLAKSKTDIAIRVTNEMADAGIRDLRDSLNTTVEHRKALREEHLVKETKQIETRTKQLEKEEKAKRVQDGVEKLEQAGEIVTGAMQNIAGNLKISDDFRDLILAHTKKIGVEFISELAQDIEKEKRFED